MPNITRSGFSSRPTLAIATMLMAGTPAAALLFAPVSTAAAQETASRVEPYVVVFTQAEVPVRAGSSIIYYPIVFPKTGDTLVVDGETTGWLRVMYPAGVRALVMTDEAQETPNGTVRLTRASKLKAPNANSGFKGAFLGVQDTELPIGTELKLLESIKDDSGKVVVYAVEAPSTARGWVSRDAVRRATESEAAPVLAKVRTGPVGSPGTVSSTPVKTDAPAAAPTPSATTPSPAVVNSTPANPPVTVPVPATTPNPAAATSTTPAANTDTAPVAKTPDPVRGEPVQIPTIAPSPAGNDGSGQPGATPVATPPGMEIPNTVPVGDKDGGGGGGSVKTPPATIPVGSINSVEGLKALYDRVRAQPSASAELELAIAEFERYKGTLSNSSRDVAAAKQLDSYITVLKLRKDVRDAQNANAAINRDTELMKTDVGKKVIELEKQRVYTIIGRLVRSTVYDGGRAPELYRVMSPEPGSARTLGYLLPDPKFDYTNKVEQVVGIIGDLRPDESLRTNLIVPRRVDVVSLAPITAVPDVQPVAVPSSKPATPAKPEATMPKLPSQTPPVVAPPTPAPADQPEKP